MPKENYEKAKVELNVNQQKKILAKLIPDELQFVRGASNKQIASILRKN